MTYKGDPIAEKLDKLAEMTGVPGLQRRAEAAGPPNPVRFRVVPLILLAFATGGLVVQIIHPWALGYFTIMMVWFATLLVFTFGPLGRAARR